MLGLNQTEEKLKNFYKTINKNNKTMAKVRDYEDLGDEDLLLRVKIIKKSKRLTNVQNQLHNKKKPWKKGRDKVKAFIVQFLSRLCGGESSLLIAII